MHTGGSRMKLHLSLFIAIALFVSGCGPRYKIGGETFSSPSEALTKQQEIEARSLPEITPTDNHVGGTALILIPSDIEIQNNYLRQHGNFAYGPKKEDIDWLVTSIRNVFLFTADSIKKREIFNSISVDRHNGNPASNSGGENDYIVYVDVDGWYIKSKNNPHALRVPFDNTKPAGTPRSIAFLDLLSQQARELNIK